MQQCSLSKTFKELSKYQKIGEILLFIKIKMKRIVDFLI